MTKRRHRWFALLVPFLLVAAACGDDDTPDEGGGATTTAAPAGDDFEGLAFDESAQCGTDGYGGNMASIEAVDRLTVRFTLCNPDVAFPSKVAFIPLGIQSEDYLTETGGGQELVENPIGTGPYRLEAWDHGNQVVLVRNEEYWGDAPAFEQVVFRFSAEASQRLIELQNGAVQGIDNVGTDDFETIEGDSALQLLERLAMNVFYVGFNVDTAPFDNELVRQAIGFAIDKQRLVDNFYPRGSVAATQFLPETIPGFVEDFEGFTFNQERARELLAEAGFPDGFDTTLSLRDVVRGYLPQPVAVATDIQAQLAEVGINVTLDVQESGVFIDGANGGTLGLHLLGWGADFPDAVNFLDQHFGDAASPQFGSGFDDIHAILSDAASLTDQGERDALYEEAAQLIFEHAPMIPIAHGGSATAYLADVEQAQASPLSNETFSVMSLGDETQFVWMQNAEPLGLYCADETDGESLRACEQINEALLSYEINGVEVQPALATAFEANEDLTEWTFTLRDGVTFHDGSEFDANDVVATYRVQWDAADPLHVGRAGDFTYFSALFGGFLNPPPEE